MEESFFFFDMEGTILTTSCCPFLEKEGIVHQSFYTNTPKTKMEKQKQKKKKKNSKKVISLEQLEPC